MKKPLALILSAALALSLLAGCGAAPAAPTPTEAPAVTAAPPEETAAPAPTEAPAPESVTVRIGALTGPTAMGMAKLLHDAAAGETENAYEPLLCGAADELTPHILQGDLDIAAVPLNLASVLYNKTEGAVELLAVNVLGVLYITEYGGESISSVADLKGQTLYATGKGAVPEYFLRYILRENGLDMDTDLTVEWKSEPGEVVATLKAQGRGVAMLPQPYVTAAAAQLGEGFRTALSVSDEWDALASGSRCVTAGIIVRREFAQAHPEAVETFLREYAASAAWVNENPAEAGGYCEELNIAKAAVAARAIPFCNIVCITGADMRSAAEGCLTVLHGLNGAAVGGALPGEDFYYGAE